MAMWGHASAIAMNSAFIVACVEPTGGKHLEITHDPDRPIGSAAPEDDAWSPTADPALSTGRCLHEHQDAYKSRRDVPTGADLKWLALELLPCLVGVRTHGARGSEHDSGSRAELAEVIRTPLRI